MPPGRGCSRARPVCGRAAGRRSSQALSAHASPFPFAPPHPPPRPPARPPHQGSAFYIGGALLVIVGWTFVGLVVEAYGFWLLFCEFIPTVLTYSRRLPFVGRMLEVPWLRTVRGAEGGGAARVMVVGGR